VVLDPRATYTVEDRKAQFDLVVQLGKTMGHMTYGVAAIEGVRDAAAADSAKLSATDALRSRLEHLADESGKLRSKIVATKEGGAITGEERIREHLGEVYGDVNGYEGRPTADQTARAASLAKELEDVIADFRKLTDAELPAINASLKKKKMEVISVLAEADWQKQQESGAGTKPPANVFREVD
jgi:hypothetical protein